MPKFSAQNQYVKRVPGVVACTYKPALEKEVNLWGLRGSQTRLLSKLSAGKKYCVKKKTRLTYNPGAGEDSLVYIESSSSSPQIWKT